MRRCSQKAQVKASRRTEAPGACRLGGEQARADSALTGDPEGERPCAVKRCLKAELSLMGLLGDSMSQSM